jgi:hypothetical protein
MEEQGKNLPTDASRIDHIDRLTFTFLLASPRDWVISTTLMMEKMMIRCPIVNMMPTPILFFFEIRSPMRSLMGRTITATSVKMSMQVVKTTKLTLAFAAQASICISLDHSAKFKGWPTLDIHRETSAQRAAFEKVEHDTGDPSDDTESHDAPPPLHVSPDVKEQSLVEHQE